MRSDKWQTVLLSVASSAATVILVLSFRVLADSNPTTDSVPRLVPYQGTLEKDGAPFNGPIQMVFRLFDGATAANPVWEEEQTVTVYAGRFSVLLGSTTAQSASSLATALTAADDQYLGITLLTEAGDTPLGNRQRFVPVPYALWTTAATSFRVNGKLSVYGPDIEFTSHPDRGDGGRAVVHSTGDSLTLNFAGDFAGGTKVQGGTVTSAGPALQVQSGSQTLKVDGNNLESNSTLFLNRNSGQTVTVGDWLHLDQSYKWISFGAGSNAGVAIKYDEANDRQILNSQGSFSGGTRVEGALHAAGDVTAAGGVQVSGALRAASFTADQKLVELKQFNVGDNGQIDTGYLASDWHCVVGSVVMADGDINEGGTTATPFRAYTYRQSGHWYVNAELASHNNNEESTVGVVCFRTGISNLVSWW